MQLKSPVFYDTTMLPPKYTCDGQKINPPLLISDVPKNAVSLVLIVDDPDSVGGNWIHWLVWNIDPSITEIKENSVPQNGIEGINSFGDKGYGAPCPPSGNHRYVFKLYALDTRLDPDSKTTSSQLEKEMEGHVLAKTQLTGIYGRKR